MGSFKEYYNDVRKFQTKLSKDEEKIQLIALTNARLQLKDEIFSIGGMISIIIKEVSKLTSIASVTEDFNSNKTGNNKKIENQIISLLSNPTKGNLHLCNFKIEWLIKLTQKHNITTDAIGKYLKDIEKIEHVLVNSCLKTAVQLALTYRGKMHHEDAVQIANLALLESVKKFNPKMGVRFNTYAHHKILFRMKQALMEDPFGIVHIPRSASVEDGTGSWLSLDDTNDSGRQRPLSDIIPDELNLENETDKALIKDRIKTILKAHLTSQEQDILNERYLDHKSVLTYQDVSDHLKISLTKERIRQIEEKAINKLKTKPGLKILLESYLGE